MQGGEVKRGAGMFYSPLSRLVNKLSILVNTVRVVNVYE